MSRPKGLPKTGGRRPGSPNKVTVEFREAVTRLLDENADNMRFWLQQVAATDPDKALDKLCRLAEFAAPKLARTEIYGDPEKPLAITRIELVPLNGKRANSDS